MREDDPDFPADWSAHRTNPVGEHLHLAKAAAIAASILTYPWGEDDLLGPAGLPPAPRLPTTAQAFDAAGAPVTAMHGRFGHLVRRCRETGGFDPDPVADADATAITWEEWNDAECEAGWLASSRQACRTIAPIVADAIARAAARDLIATWGRPIGGTEMVRLEPRHWMLDDPVRRLAACTLALDAPNDADAAPDHLVFVEAAGFREAMHSFRPTHFRHIVRELAGSPPPDAETYAALRRRVEDAMLRAVMADPDRRWYRHALADAVEKEVGAVADGVFEAARARVQRQVGRLAPRGRPTATSTRSPADGSSAHASAPSPPRLRIVRAGMPGDAT